MRNSSFEPVQIHNSAIQPENNNFNMIGSQHATTTSYEPEQSYNSFSASENTATSKYEPIRKDFPAPTTEISDFYKLDDEMIPHQSNALSNQPTRPSSSLSYREPTPQNSIASTSNNADLIDLDDDIIDLDSFNLENLDDTMMVSATQANPSIISVHYDMATEDDEFEPEYPWSKDVYDVLRKVFGLNKFRHNQLKAINATLKGQDVFVLMPTGGGKSLCYQLPALIDSGYTQGVTIVISPLLALVQDQVERLQSLGVHAFALNSDSTAEQRRHFYSDLRTRDPKIKLAYITPEMLNKSSAIRDILKNLYEKQKLSRFVIDEAHCVSQWGHDFRPDYKQVGFVKSEYPTIPILALTATANNQVKADVKQNLNILNCLTLTQSFNRKNLHYIIRKKVHRTVVPDIYSYITNNHAGSCGIIYCTSRKSCEELAEVLSRNYNLEAIHYHAGLSKEDRQRIQRDWQNGVFKVIVATVAFGMGIDKPDVRFVIHHSLPHSMEGYYQETGRAGRDGRDSECILFYNYADKKIIDFMIKNGDGDFDTKERQRNNLNRVVQFCENLIDCRRQQILAYFGESFDRAFCYGSCDNCVTSGKAQYIQKDVTEIAKQLVKIVYLTQSQKITIRNLLLVFRGSNCKKARSYNIDSELLGCGKTLSLTDSERLVHDLISKNILKETSLYNKKGFASSYLFTGPSARQLLSGSIIVNMDFDEALNKSKPKVVKVTKPTNKRKSGQRGSESIPILPDSPNGPINLSSGDAEYNSEDYEDLRDEEYMYNNDSDADYIDEDYNPEPETPQTLCTKEMKKLRTRIYSETKLPLYKIFTDTSLNSIIKSAPSTIEDLKQNSTLSADIISRYHGDILGITNKYLNNSSRSKSNATRSRSQAADDNVDDLQIISTKTSHLTGFQSASSIGKYIYII
jgi:RecQ family ATP-dependent DNA helicase